MAEKGALSLSLKAKLPRALQEKNYERSGHWV
ncbi:MAG: hypothetical protein A4E72_01914 [Syntrophus sp. PtaU1.Bin208]|nr:MAG: hypothetical protein A4E72_01914 [Syntrophus sp. PtaU1.Bin208]